jgi:hypothetical protein
VYDRGFYLQEGQNCGQQAVGKLRHTARVSNDYGKGTVLADATMEPNPPSLHDFFFTPLPTKGDADDRVFFYESGIPLPME